MTITCKFCGRQHALFWLQGTGQKKLHYTCNQCPVRKTTVTGREEIRHVTKRCQYHPVEPISAKELDALPIVFTKAMAKKETDAHQEKLPL